MAIELRSPDELSCVLIPQPALPLLLPHESVAEILRSGDVRPRDEVPNWLLGTLSWRGMDVPVVSMHALLGSAEPPGHDSGQLVVLNRSRALPGLPYYALPSRGVPRLLRLVEADLVRAEQAGVDAAVGTAVRVGEERALIPRLELLEDLLQGYLPH